MSLSSHPARRRAYIHPLIPAVLLLLAPGAALAQPATAAFAVKNATATPIRCFVMEGGPITKLVTLKPGQERVSRIGPAQRVSLACPKVRDTVFGPYGPGRYEFRKAKGRTDLFALP